MFSNLTINPVSRSALAGRMALAVACAATMFALAVTPALAANATVQSNSRCDAVSVQAATFARVQMGVVKSC
jgi:hypothetical protein